MVRSRVIKGAKDRYGRTRKFIQIPDTYYHDFEFGDLVRIEKVEMPKQES